jgi:hypothetical protein
MGKGAAARILQIVLTYAWKIDSFSSDWRQPIVITITFSSDARHRLFAPPRTD